MNPDRWRQIEELFHAALEQEPARRRFFVGEAAGADDELRREVETLLDHEAHGETILESRALEVASRLLADDVLVGRTMGPYTIQSRIGGGGMGEVYFASDERLGRGVALKFLPGIFSNDPGRLVRFEKEARAASALNHPNIVTVHEIGSAGPLRFIATEFVQGSTLRQRLERGPLPLEDALDVAIQIASALAAAHQAGIVHRDVKPENLMLREDGYVKVLDFGLAKLLEKPAAENAGDTAPPRDITDSWLDMGTIPYMSPEQLANEPADKRSDIFSFGVVLYEMVAGRRPFERSGGGADATITPEGPPPLPEHARITELETILRRALAGDRGRRYQSMQELHRDLKRVRRRLEVEAELRGAPGRGRARRRVASLLALATAFVSLAYLLLNRADREAPSLPFERTNITKLTTSGKAVDAVISSDGRYVAYVSDSGGRSSLSVLEPAASRTTEIVPAAEVQYWGLTFSPEGREIYYVVWHINSNQAALCRVSVDGGAQQKLMDPSGSAVTFSPGGSRIAFVNNSRRLKQSKLFIADRDARDARVLAAREDPSYFCDFLTAPAWSPDGKIIASPAGSPDPSGLLRYIVGVRTADSVEVPIGSRRWYDVQRVVWMRDGAGLVATASDRIASPHQLWFVGYPDGTVRRITNDQDDYYGVSATADSTALVTVQTDRVANLWVVPDLDARRALEITSEAHKTSAMEGLAWTPDGRIVYRSSAGGAQDIWITKPDGTGGLQLTTGAGNNLHPAVCGDGRYVVFVSDRAGSLNVWRMDLDGRNPKRLTSGANEMFPTCSPDGKWVVYQRGYGYDLVHNLYRVPIEGGEPVQLTHRTSRAPVFSPDGNRIAFFELTEQGWGFTVLRADTGVPLHGFHMLPSVLSRAIRWTPDGRGLAYAVTSAGIGNVWVQPLDGGSPRQLTDFRSGLLFDFAWSPDGRTLACLRGTQTSDVVLVKDLRR